MSEMSQEEMLKEIEKIKERDRLLRENARQNSETEKTDINVTIDTNDIRKQLIEKADLEAKLKSGICIDIGKEVIEKLKAKADELNIEYTEENFKSKEDFQAFAYIVAQKQREMNRPAPKGVVPLNPAQTGERTSEGFDSYEEMIDFLQDQASKGGALGSGNENEAQKILTQLWQNMLRTQKIHKQSFEYEDISDKPLGKQLTEKMRRRKGIHVKGEE